MSNTIPSGASYNDQTVSTHIRSYLLDTEPESDDFAVAAKNLKTVVETEMLELRARQEASQSAADQLLKERQTDIAAASAVAQAKQNRLQTIATFVAAATQVASIVAVLVFEGRGNVLTTKSFSWIPRARL